MSIKIEIEKGDMIYEKLEALSFTVINLMNQYKYRSRREKINYALSAEYLTKINDSISNIDELCKIKETN